MIRNTVSKFALGLGFALAIGGAAQAATSPLGVSTDGPANILELKLQAAYGATSYAGSLATTLTLDNGISFVRVQDTGGGALPIGGSAAGASDQSWTDGTVKAQMEVKVAGKNHTLYVDSGANGTLDTLVFDAVDEDQVGETTGWFLIGPSFGWALDVYGTGYPNTDLFSVESLNADSTDHMITFEILGLAGAYKTWLIAWEDKLVGEPNADFDYNDAVYQISVVPVPAAAWAGMALLSGIAAVRRARKA